MLLGFALPDLRDWSLTSIVAMTSAILTGDLSERMMS